MLTGPPATAALARQGRETRRGVGGVTYGGPKRGTGGSRHRTNRRDAYMEFTPTTAATMAQILALVMLATAFDPVLRGSLATRYFRDADGELHKIPALGTGDRRYYAKFRLFSIVATAIAIGVNSVYFMIGDTASGGFGFALLVVNSFALGSTISEAVRAAYQHLANNNRQHAEPES